MGADGRTAALAAGARALLEPLRPGCGWSGGSGWLRGAHGGARRRPAAGSGDYGARGSAAMPASSPATSTSCASRCERPSARSSTTTCRWGVWSCAAERCRRPHRTSASCAATRPRTPRCWRSARRRGGRELARPGRVLYVTLEPCAMCAGAIVLGARAARGLRRRRPEGRSGGERARRARPSHASTTARR